MKPDVCIEGMPKVNGECLDDVVLGITEAMFNMDLDTFKEGFVKHGGDEGMARHIWDKWKSEHHDNFMWTYGNLDKKNREKVIATALDFHKELEERARRVMTR